ncbi:uncharacterized protein LOC120342818 isoform X2 [Styela clava]
MNLHTWNNIENGNDSIIYRNTILAGLFKDKEKENSIITRLSGYFRFHVECRVPTSFNYTSDDITDISLSMNETMDIEKLVKGKTKSLKVKVEFRNSNWNSLYSYMVGERLYVEIWLERETSNEILSKYGFLKPVTCYATPNKEGFWPSILHT